MTRRRWIWLVGGAIAMSGASIAAVIAWLRAPAPPPVAHDPRLRGLPLYLYPATDSSRPPRALVFFFGNDIGFWRPHQRLAWNLSANQYAVAGLDMREMLRSLPDTRAARDSAFVARIVPLIMQCRHELRAEAVPLVIAGHSLGAEIALWTAAFARPPGAVGVLALSPGSRSHLAVSLSDLTMTSEPTGPLSFSVADAVAHVPDHERLALVRGERDKLAAADPQLLRAGGSRARRFVVRFAGHSLKGGIVSLRVVRLALDWILEGNTAQTSPGR